MCIINKSAHSKKKSGNLFNDPRKYFWSIKTVVSISCSALEMWLMCLLLLFQQCLACFVWLIFVVCKKGCKWL